MNKDIIYRQDAIDVLAELARDRFTIQDWYQIYIDALKDADKKIRYLPSAERKNAKWTENEAAKQLNDLIFDINPAEICSQIQSDNLKQWCETIQTAMKMAMVQLPCWGGNE